MDDSFGPFSVRPPQVAGLGGAVFQELVSRLLAAEASAAGFAGWQLHTSHQENVADGGVDALLESDRATKWVPAGESVWQFKAGDLGPESCANELAGAEFAREVLARGASYNLVLGKAMESKLLNARKAKLVKKAAELGLGSLSVRVLDGNQLARWVESVPALAVARVLGGVGHVAIGFDSWEQKSVHQPAWVESEERAETTRVIRAFLASQSAPDLRVEGPSGIGKTRAVLESLRSPQYESTVLYIGDAADLPPAFIEQLIRQERRALIVVDECPRQRHKVFSEMLEPSGTVRLITIGERDTYLLQSRSLGVSALPDEAVDQILQQNYTQLWAEARRVVVENSHGNIRWALLLAHTILENPGAAMRDLVATGELREITLGLMGGSGDFLARSALALFTRFGFDRDRQQELQLIADNLDIPLRDLQRAVLDLDNAGLLNKQGRYRGITPQPLAVLLATHAWQSHGRLIMTRLLPALDESMVERLFLRAADLGSEGPAAVALNDLLGPDGPFASLDVMSRASRSESLIQLAVISPAAVLDHLDRVLGAATDQDLREAKNARRDLVWTLEKLVWHSDLFEQAADLLLKLAVSENEKISNNATGTWLGLFASLLPATAAAPEQRLSYLRRCAQHPVGRIRELTIEASRQALDTHDSVIVSGELQGGAVVEPRGMPSTLQEAWDYQRAALGILRQLAVDDQDAKVRDAAVSTLVEAIHPTLENVETREVLFSALRSLDAGGRQQVWVAIEHLQALLGKVRAMAPDEASGAHDVAERVQALSLLAESMPPLSETDQLRVLANVRRWDFEEGELGRRIEAAARAVGAEHATPILLSLLRDSQPVEASFEIGSVLHEMAEHAVAEPALAETAKAGDITALVGYLWAAVRAGRADAFDAFLDGDVGTSLAAGTRLAITVRGPKTETAWDRVLTLQTELPVHAGASAMFGWHDRDVDDARLRVLLSGWIPRIVTQLDYNSAVDAVAHLIHRRSDLSSAFRALLTELVEMRRTYPVLGNQNHDWTRLARRAAEEDPGALLTSMLEQIESGQLTVFPGSEEQRLLQTAIEEAGPTSLTQTFGMVQSGSWRAQMEFRGWLTDLYPARDVLAWIGEDVNRARVVASMTGIGTGKPSGLLQSLLELFGSDDRVTASLYGNLVSGSWTGKESSRISRQIEQLDSWLSDDQLGPAVKAWARKVRRDLRRSREMALEREAERGY
ncbi:hypothetical protein [Nocardioides aurantiacus]|uniref:hypothetical protein n=1 Tax=Nocardioides aurantiacus TaxID=86796 RepID=UPI00403F6EA2